MRHDNQGSFSAQVVDEELEEGVNGEGFVYVSNRVDKSSRGKRHHACEGRNRIDGNHEQDSNNVALKQGLPVVFRLKPYRAKGAGLSA